MINRDLKLNILHDDNSVFTDYSKEMVNFDRLDMDITFTTSEDFLYVGFSKPINTIFIEVATADATVNDLTIEYYKTDTWTSVSNLYDETEGFTRSGFIQWDRNLTDDTATSINSTSKYWYRISSDATLTLSLRAINIVFSDDNDLKREFFEYSEYLPTGESSFILTHVSARDEIMQALNVKGLDKKRSSDNWIVDINAFDMLNIQQLRNASTYLVLSKIFMNVSDAVDDFYFQKSRYYKGMSSDIVNGYNFTIDADDDGELDKVEKDAIRYGEIKRI